jgi:hypothetical protein
VHYNGYQGTDLAEFSRIVANTVGDVRVPLDNSTIGYIVSYGSDTLAIYGHNVLWTGVGQVWASVNPFIHTYGVGLPLTKLSIELLQEAQDKSHVRRSNTQIHATARGDWRWANLIGFEDEYVMKEGAVDGGDLIGMVKWNGVRKWHS